MTGVYIDKRKHTPTLRPGNLKGLVLAALLFILYSHHVLSQKGSYSIELASFSSHRNDDFSPAYYKNGILFCSNRKKNSLISYNSFQKPLFNMYFVELIDSSKWGKTKIFANELTTILNDGPASLNNDENIIYFARNNHINPKLKDISDSTNHIGIYSAENVNGKWINIRAFIHNNPKYSLRSPSLSQDGKRIYFSSNMPGGFGGFDLYYSNLEGNKWQDPINLGSSVNTSANEGFPYSCKSGKLYFASNGHKGLGGEDIYYTMDDQGKWKSPINLGPEFNSAADDFGFITDADFQLGYFSSNRRKYDDIYTFKNTSIQFENCIEQKENKFCFLFYDEKVIFSDTLSVSYEWDFGSGVKKYGERVKHCFSEAGEYSVILTITNNDTGDTINNPTPYLIELQDIEQAYINSENIGYVNETICFDALKTNLPNFSISEYLWDFGDGFRTLGPSIEYNFDKEGEFFVKLGILGTKDSLGAVPKVCVSKKIAIINRE